MLANRFSFYPAIGAYINAAKYGRLWSDAREVGVSWDDPRDVCAVIMRFEHTPIDLSKEDLKVQYWQSSWPKFRFDQAGAGFSGWLPIDDLYNGQWKDAEFDLNIEGDALLFTFKPITSEFPELTDYDVKFRRTLKVRVLSSKNLSGIKSFEVYTDSTWRLMEVSIEWGCGKDEKRVWDGFIDVFNGEIKDLKPLNPNSKVKILPNNSWSSKIENDETDGIRAEIFYAYSEKPKSFDETIVTIRSATFSFSFSMKDLERERAILIKDYDVLISKSSENLNLKTYSSMLSEKGLATIYDMIDKMPEQSLERAWKEMPTKKRSIHFILGCKGRRQKIGVDTRGTVFIPKLWNIRVKGKCSDRFLWDGGTIAYGFGFPDKEPEERYLEGEYLPIVHAKWVEDGIVFEQEAFATLLLKNPLDDLKGEEMIDGDDPVVCMMKITLFSQSLSPKNICLKLSSLCKENWRDAKGVEEQLKCENGLIYALYQSHPIKRLRYVLDVGGRGEIKDSDGSLIYALNLNPGEKHTVYVKIPAITPLENFEVERLKSLDFELEKKRVIQYWKSLLSQGMLINVPEKWLNNFYKAFLSHVHITDDKEPGSERYMCRVSSFNYGVFANESAMVISELDRRGLYDEAERRLDVFIRYQGTAVMAGKYSTAKGVFFGAGGYECGDYGQHHGWVLWAFAEHYKHTRDEEWLKKVAPNLVEACNWIIEERKATMRTINGKKVVEYGFLPPGSLEDVKEFWHWISTNAHAYRGLKSVAEVLSEINHPEAERLIREAEAYREDLLAGITEAMVRSPVVKLRDGTWVPHIPSRVDRRGRDIGWIRETLEGAMHLILCGLIDPHSKTAEWIMKDYEDNLYISEEYGYSVPSPDFDRYWFSRGGFSMQPNLYGFQIPYLLRGKNKHFLRAFFNAFAVAFYPDVYMLTEHPLPTMADWAGDHFKTSDESIACYCLRLMLIHEKGSTLTLMPAVPSKWLENGKHIYVENASTYFGTLSFTVESRVAEGFIKVYLKPPTRNPPKYIEIYVKHPSGLKIRDVKVDGKEWPNYDSETSLILLGGITKPVEINVYY
ncbi:MAG: hypothetical protein N3E47_00165 [Candidatus Bathyarchaeota archaeon]|nr:hypothetical protein [Candidatus Bathyarchaeota archaeon]